MSLYPSTSGPRSRTQSPPPRSAPRVIPAVSDDVKAKINALADLFQSQMTRRSGMTLVSYEEDTHNPLLYSFYFQDKTPPHSPDKIYRLVSQIIQPVSEDVNVIQAGDCRPVAQIIQPQPEDTKVPHMTHPHLEDAKVAKVKHSRESVFRIDLSATDLLNVRPECFQVLRHPHVQTTLVYVLGFVSIAIPCLLYL